MTIMLGNTPLLPVTAAINRLTVLLWGLSGCGKTVLASTMPGKKLWIQFDPDGVASVSDRTDVEVLDFSQAEHSVVENFNERGVYEQLFDNMLKDRPDLETIVLDSATSYAEKALLYGITSGKADGKSKQGGVSFKATLGQPGMAGYGFRNRYVLGIITMLLRLTAKHKRNFVVVCHEGAAEKDNDGKPTSITVLLGGSLPQEVPLQISEVWHVADTGHDRLIRIRPFGIRSPMRSRMFNMTGDGLIVWKYDQAKDEGMKIATWYQQWRDGGFKKLPLPK